MLKFWMMTSYIRNFINVYVQPYPSGYSGMVLYNCYKDGIKVGIFETDGEKQTYKFGQATVSR